jgi:hypothetical protein
MEELVETEGGMAKGGRSLESWWRLKASSFSVSQKLPNPSGYNDNKYSIPSNIVRCLYGVDAGVWCNINGLVHTTFDISSPRAHRSHMPHIDKVLDCVRRAFSIEESAFAYTYYVIALMDSKLASCIMIRVT